LLSESQYDNPRLMRPFKKAIYYEKIRCRTGEEDQEETPSSTIKSNSDKSNQKKEKGPHKNRFSTSPSPNSFSPTINKEDILSSTPEPAIQSSTQINTSQGQSGKTNEQALEEFTPRPKISKKQEEMSFLKKLAAKVHEFNLRFRSR